MNLIKTLILTSILAAIGSVYAAYDLYDRAEAILEAKIKRGEWYAVAPCFVVDNWEERDVFYAVENEFGEVELRRQ